MIDGVAGDRHLALAETPVAVVVAVEPAAPLVAAVVAAAVAQFARDDNAVLSQ